MTTIIYIFHDPTEATKTNPLGIMGVSADGEWQQYELIDPEHELYELQDPQT